MPRTTQVPVLLAICALAVASCQKVPSAGAGGAGGQAVDAGDYADASPGRDWPGYGRTYGQQHYSPLSLISSSNVGRLGLLWSLDLAPLQNSVTEPIAVGGVIYFASGLSVIHAVDAASGKELWTYDPEAAQKAGLNLRNAWGVRGISWWNGKIYAGTADGRLIAVGAHDGKLKWSAQTIDPEMAAQVNGAPHVFNGKVIIGFGGTAGTNRAYVTAYDAETGKQLWRFHTTPGQPAKGFEDKIMAMAAKTWAGEWWKFGGGGNVWNSISYDAETDTVFLGTGSGYPWNRRARSADRGDNLFVASIVALDGNTGGYKWHYQVNPGDTWDFDAAMDISLADLVIDGKPRKVLLQAPKNGFFYVIDRTNGKFITAQPYATVTWAKAIDPASGRPIENPGVRYPNGSAVTIAPQTLGAHGWMAMAYSPLTRLAYIPVTDASMCFTDAGIDLGALRPQTDRTLLGDIGQCPSNGKTPTKDFATGARGVLVAWDPVRQKPAWKVAHPTPFNGGVLATGGGLVVQGGLDGALRVYSASDGRELWSFNVQAPILSPPISFEVGGRQYISVLTGTGMGTSAAISSMADRYGLDPLNQSRRLLTFALDATGHLPARSKAPAIGDDPGFRDDAAQDGRGGMLFAMRCTGCHGIAAVGSSHAPDLRRSSVALSKQAFHDVLVGGALVPAGMPNFPEFTDRQLEDLSHYIRSRAQALRTAQPGRPGTDTRAHGWHP